MRWYPRFAVGVVVYNLAVIVWGAFVRATGSGAGCGSHWPVCNGVVVPRSPTVETVIEYTHRVTSGLALVAVVVLVAGAWRLYPRGHAVRRPALLSLVFMLVEAALGAMLVLFGWVAGDRSLARGVVVPVHLANTLILLGALTLTARAALGGEPLRLRGRSLARGLVVAALALLVVLSSSGAVTALGDTLFPAGSLAEGFAQDRSPTAHLFLRLRILHPGLAFLTALLVAAAATAAWTDAPTAPVRRLVKTLAGLFALQMAAGVVNLLLLAPVWLQLVHLLLADLVWIALVLLGARLFSADAEAAAAPQPQPALARR